VAVLVAGLGAGLLLAGCAGDPVPEPTYGTPPPASAPTPTPTPTGVTAPERPADMDRGDEVGAVAAARYFMELFAYAMVSGDLTEWDAVSATDCDFCATVHSDVTERYASGGRFAGGGLAEFVGTAGPQHPQLGGYPVNARFTIRAGQELDSAGAVVSEIDEEHAEAVLDVAYSVDGWVLVEASTDPERSVYGQ
jgi:hypothetical protein